MRVPNEPRIQECDQQVYVSIVVFGVEIHYGARYTNEAYFSSTTLEHPGIDIPLNRKRPCYGALFRARSANRPDIEVSEADLAAPHFRTDDLQGQRFLEPVQLAVVLLCTLDDRW